MNNSGWLMIDPYDGVDWYHWSNYTYKKYTHGFNMNIYDLKNFICMGTDYRKDITLTVKATVVLPREFVL